MLVLRQILRHALLAGLTAPNVCYATTGLVSVDASSLPPKAEVGPLVMGSATAGIGPRGNTLAVNSQSLVRNGQPWVPVSGEFHYSRYPADQWLPELLKMKAAGIDIVSTYTIWIHHEEVQNKFDFSGDRNITRFVETVAAAGLFLVARLGPYAHAEVRNGGIPDFVNNTSVIRSNDPTYISYVTSYWTELAGRIDGSLFKHGGPIIAVQLENEYSLDGPGQGAAHISKLKALAISLGLDVPLYTCTGWQDTHYPPDQVVPVFGGYQDAPWDTTLEDEPPNETYSFRFFSRETGSDGYEDFNATGAEVPNSQWGLAAYPFLTGEYGAGAASMYRRRVDMYLPDDIAATIPVQLGSGVNLFGYYMFHGGVNPQATEPNITLQESTATGSYNDLTVMNYDYQSPLGQYGQQRSTLNRIKQYHYWLNGYGSQLAGMSMRQPAVIANSSLDLASLRWSVRSDSKSGYLFVNNYVRQHKMLAHTNVQFAVKFSSGIITVPSAPITISTGAYFVWPLNLALGSVKLAYATAQLMTSIEVAGHMVHVFIATAGIPVEFAFDPTTVSHVKAIASTTFVHTSANATDFTMASSILPSLKVALQVTDKSGKSIDIVVLDQSTADKLWRIPLAGQDTLVLTNQAFGLTSSGFELTSAGSPMFSFFTFPAIKIDKSATTTPLSTGVSPSGGIFTGFTASLQTRKLSITVSQVKLPGVAPPILIGGEAKGALIPSDTVIAATQGLWSIQIPWSKLNDADDAWLTINYEGDLARLYAGSLLLDDHYYDGDSWVVGLKRLAASAKNGNLTLAIMPLRSDAPVYLQTTPTFGSNGQACTVSNVTISTVYRLQVDVS